MLLFTTANIQFLIIISLAIEEPPFEVTETGWGEFEISIRVYFVPEASEKNVAMYHHLKLHPYGPEAEQQKAEGATVTSLQYDEFVCNSFCYEFYL